MWMWVGLGRRVRYIKLGKVRGRGVFVGDLKGGKGREGGEGLALGF